jgi:hypothetical protein
MPIRLSLDLRVLGQTMANPHPGEAAPRNHQAITATDKTHAPKAISTSPNQKSPSYAGSIRDWHGMTNFCRRW